MKTILNSVRRFRDDEDGAAMVEYTILLGLITVATIGAVVFIGGWTSAQWGKLQTDLTGKGAPVN